MNDESFEPIEAQLGGLHVPAAPRELRQAVLSDIQRELRASRWDRRLFRTAAVLLITGAGLNAGVIFSPSHGGTSPIQSADSNARQTLVNAATAIAEATNAKTGSEYARRVAAMIGHELTAEDEAAIDAAAGQTVTHASTNGNKG